jgi:predicted amidohydrolase YtcJ
VSVTVLAGVRRVGTRGAPADVLLRDGVVAGIAPADIDPALAAAADEIVDARGAWLLPGLWDHHTHLDQWALVRRRLDVSGCDSAAAVAALVAGAARTTGADDVLVGYGYRDGLWRDEPDRRLLDRAAPGLQTAVISADLHAVWCSTALLSRVGLGDHPTGLLREREAFAVTAALDTVSDAVLDGYVADAVEAASARGVVGVVDLEMVFGLDRWTRRIRSGTDGLRVRSCVYPDEFEAVVARGLRTGDVVPGTHGLLAMGPFKIITDGSLGTRTAALHDGTGVLAYPPDEVEALVRLAVDSGLVPAVHAIGDRANTLALDVFEAVGCRGSIEHAQLLRDVDIERFARLGVTASVQPEHAMDDRDLVDASWGDAARRAYAFARLHAAGVRLQFGSDAPVAPLDPWIAMAAAVGRTRDGREPWQPQERLDRLAALAASTDGRVSVAVGDVADLALVEHDPLDASVPLPVLRAMPVVGTLVDGRWTHRDL